jgi:hypothetical protein
MIQNAFWKKQLVGERSDKRNLNKSQLFGLHSGLTKANNKFGKKSNFRVP